MHFEAAALAEPRHLILPTTWTGHVPFALWLVPILKPAILVELSTQLGNSHLAFCQAIQQHNLAARAYAIDISPADVSFAVCGDSSLKSFKEVHDPAYGGFSDLLRVSLETADQGFVNGSIDLLHIDVPRSYAAVRRIFDAWLPKLSSRAVVLVHNTQIMEGDAGSHRLWKELVDQYPSFGFSHGQGLGVLLVGSDRVSDIERLCSGASHNKHWILARRFFQAVGGGLEARAMRQELSNRLATLQSKADDLGKFGRQQQQLSVELKKDAIHLQKDVAKHEAAAREVGSLLMQALDRSRNIEKPVPGSPFDAQISRLERERDDLIRTVEEIKSSRSWRITAGYRFSGIAALRGRNLLRLILTGRWRDVRARFGEILGTQPRQVGTDSGAAHENHIADHDPLTLTAPAQQQIVMSGQLLATRVAGIITPPHTLFVAKALRRSLAKANIQVEIFDRAPENFELDLYFVMCPQIFDRLPPSKKRICFQMEQSVSSRWFTADYLKALRNSLAVFDYSIRNLSFLEKNEVSYPRTFLLPIGGIPNHGLNRSDASVGSDCKKAFDVLFYGDINNDRRRRVLDAIGRKFSVRIINDLFGDALEEEVRRARVVINVHYYEGALLETTRIYECLSLGARVVSEEGSDQEEHLSLCDAVTFVPVDNIDALLDAIQRELHRDGHDRSVAVDRAVAESAERFDFMLFRALQALRIIDHEMFSRVAGNTKRLGSRIGLSLPETPRRRAAFKKIRPPGFSVFDGIRASPSWVGCALSYRYLARNALQNGLERLTICEDDVEFPPLFEQKMSIVSRFLDARLAQWDIFAGLIADLHPDTRIIDLVEEDGLSIVTIDKMTSAVYNIYSRRALELLSEWQVENDDVVTNTIDRYLERTLSLRVVTTLPFVVGHRVDADSSLWGISNHQYVDLISRSQRRLEEKVWEFKARRAALKALGGAESASA